MIRELTAEALDRLALYGGQVAEVHWCAGHEPCWHHDLTDIPSFVGNWAYAMDYVEWPSDIDSCNETAWVGLVHEDGAVLVALEPSAVFPF